MIQRKHRKTNKKTSFLKETVENADLHKTSFLKETVENADLHKVVLNKKMTTQEYCV